MKKAQIRIALTEDDLSCAKASLIYHIRDGVTSDIMTSEKNYNIRSVIAEHLGIKEEDLHVELMIINKTINERIDNESKKRTS